MKQFGKWLFGLLAVVVVLVIIVAVFAYFNAEKEDTKDRTLADAQYSIGGGPTTCTELFGAPCDYTLQTGYNRWGGSLEQFVNSGAYGSFAREIGFPASAKLSLQACDISNTMGRTSLDFLDTARIDHPNAPTGELLVFWDKSRQQLCPATMG